MITFAITLYGNEHIWYLCVLLQSILNVYGKEMQVILYYADVDSKYIQYIKRKIPHITLKELENYQFLNTDLQTRISFKTFLWHKILTEQSLTDKVVFLDADTLILKKIDKYFDDQIDVLYTYKTHENENLSWPLNTGVILLKNSFKAIEFFRIWKELTGKLLASSEKLKQQKRNSWGGEDQACLGEMLKNSDFSGFSKKIVYNGIIFQGVPCEELNETRCVPISEKTHIIHYKGRWRHVLKNKEFTDWRPKEKCKVMYDLWFKNLSDWKKDG